MRSEVINLIELICLSEAVPGTEVGVVNVYSCSVTLDRCISILHLQVLVTHKCPRRQVLFVQPNCPLEVDYCLVMVSTQRVIVPHSAAGFWPILVIVEYVVSQVGKLTKVLLDVQYV